MDMKKVGTTLYAHISAIKTLPINLQPLVLSAIETLNSEGIRADIQVIKVDTRTNTVSLVESPDWDSAQEPIVGNAYKVTSAGIKLTKQKKNPQIYHHKWTLVDEDYKGFNIQDSKKRSDEWLEKMAGVNKQKIGYKDYWLKCLHEVGMEE